MTYITGICSKIPSVRRLASGTDPFTCDIVASDAVDRQPFVLMYAATVPESLEDSER